jgi:hypothetical protein
VINLRGIRWVGHETRMGEMRKADIILAGKDYSEDLGVEGRKILELILGN